MVYNKTNNRTAVFSDFRVQSEAELKNTVRLFLASSQLTSDEVVHWPFGSNTCNRSSGQVCAKEQPVLQPKRPYMSFVPTLRCDP